MPADQNMGPSIRHRGQRGQRGQGTRSWRLSVRQMYIAGSGVGWEPNIAIGASCQAALAARQALSQRAGSRLLFNHHPLAFGAFLATPKEVIRLWRWRGFRWRRWNTMLVGPSIGFVGLSCGHQPFRGILSSSEPFSLSRSWKRACSTFKWIAIRERG